MKEMRLKDDCLDGLSYSRLAIQIHYWNHNLRTLSELKAGLI